MGNLLDNNITNILWIDPNFNAGRLSGYTSIPSNTKIKHFKGYIERCNTFIQIVEYYKNQGEDLLHEMNSMDLDHGCDLIHAANMVNSLITGIRDFYHNEVQLVKGIVTSLSGNKISPDCTQWKVTLDQGEACFESACVIFSTGAHPHTMAKEESLQLKFGKTISGKQFPEEIHLDEALNPSALKKKITSEDRVAVIGASHSAILVLKNLTELSMPPKEIKNFHRRDLIYAIYYDDWILHDNTGLKGMAAVWAKEVLEAGKISYLNRIKLGKNPDEVYSTHLGTCTKIIYAIGYHRNALPKIFVENEEEIEDATIVYNDLNGQLLQTKDRETVRTLHGLFGYGIGFPEKVTDREGNEEYAVGLLKFMKYHNKVIPNVVVPHILSSISDMP
jgi:hypothetical protein